MFHCSHGHTASWLASTLQITAFLSGGIFLGLSITWPCSAFLSPSTSPKTMQNFTCCTLQTTATNKQSPFTSPLIPLLSGNNPSPPPILAVPPPKTSHPSGTGTTFSGYQHKGIWKHIWGFARAQGSWRMPACQSQARAWSRSSDRPICSHNKGTWHKRSWKELPWDNVSPGHCRQLRARCRWSAKLLCLATFNKTHRPIY